MDERRNGVIHVPHMVDGKVVKSEIKWSFGVKDDVYLLVFSEDYCEKVFPISKDFSELEIFSTVFDYCKNQLFNQKQKRPLRWYLKRSGLSNDSFAKDLGISYSAFSKKLNGVSPWKDYEKDLLAELLNVSIEYIDFEGEPKC